MKLKERYKEKYKEKYNEKIQLMEDTPQQTVGGIAEDGTV